MSVIGGFILVGVTLASLGYLLWKAIVILRGILRGSPDDEAEEIASGADASADRCEGCGYDLRATPDRCPECGQINDREQDRIFLLRLREDWPADPIDPVPPADMDPKGELLSTYDGLFVELWVEQLQARGVWCVVKELDRRAPEVGIVQYIRSYHLIIAEAERDRAEAIVAWFERPREPSEAAVGPLHP